MVKRGNFRSVVQREVRKALQAANAHRARDIDEVLEMAGTAIQRNQEEQEKGTTFASILRCVAASGGHIADAYDIARRNYGPDSAVTKAMGANLAESGGLLIGGDTAREVIELLRPRTAVRRGIPRIIRAPKGTKEFPMITEGASVAYTAENQDIAVSQPKTGALVMSAKKLAGLVPVSYELLNFSGSGAEDVIRDDLLAELVRVEDQHFLRGDHTQNTPRGLRYWAADDNVTSTNGTTPTQIEQDIVDLLDSLDGENVPMIRPAWIMSSRSKNKLFNLRDANGNLFFPEVRDGKLFEYPLLATNNIPTNLGGGGDESEVYLVDFSEVIIGEVDGIRIEASNNASYFEDVEGSPVMRSAFSRDQVLIRIILFHDIGVRHREAIAVKTGVQW